MKKIIFNLILKRFFRVEWDRVPQVGLPIFRIKFLGEVVADRYWNALSNSWIENSEEGEKTWLQKFLGI